MTDNTRQGAVVSGTRYVSKARIAANRRNAKKSTGPRTIAGKARSSQNALKHGLAVSEIRDRGTLHKLQQLSEEIAAEYGADVGGLALPVAEAYLEKQRIQSLKAEMTERAAMRVASNRDGMSSELIDALAFEMASGQLAQIERYERRARSRQRNCLDALIGRRPLRNRRRREEDNDQT